MRAFCPVSSSRAKHRFVVILIAAYRFVSHFFELSSLFINKFLNFAFCIGIFSRKREFSKVSTSKSAIN